MYMNENITKEQKKSNMLLASHTRYTVYTTMYMSDAVHCT